MSVRRLWEKCTRCGEMEPGRAYPDLGVFVCRSCMGATDGGVMKPGRELDALVAGKVSALEVLDAYE